MLINPTDNVEIDEETGHKTARTAIKAGERVVKYGLPIGRATRDIAPGERVHSENLRSALDEATDYRFAGDRPLPAPLPCGDTFSGWRRPDGEVGIRNDIWIIPTVGCVNGVAEELARRTGAIALTHPYGCSQLGGDHETTRLTLRGLARHPNAGGVLVLSLGCENNTPAGFRALLGDYDPDGVKFLTCQESGDELADGARLIERLRRRADGTPKERFPVSRLRVGLKCGGSDAFSGLTANPLVGRVCDRLAGYGASCILTEVPEMFGAESIITSRCANKDVFERVKRLIEDFKAYYRRHGQPVYENPSPGNRAGGITTLEEKSIGCVAKGGSSPVTDVLKLGERATRPGVSLLEGPGNDIVAVTNLAAAGAHLILFTTGRGTPLGGPVPTVKIASNAALTGAKPGWIDFDASGALRGEGDALTDVLYRLTLSVADGAPTRNELNGYREIAIFKDGVTL